MYLYISIRRVPSTCLPYTFARTTQDPMDGARPERWQPRGPGQPISSREHQAHAALVLAQPLRGASIRIGARLLAYQTQVVVVVPVSVHADARRRGVEVGDLVGR